ATVESWLDSFIALLRAGAEDPEALVGRISAVDGAALALQLQAWNETERQFPAGSLPEYLQLCLSGTGEAVTTGGHTLTYAELEERSNRLSHYLASKG